MSTSHRHSISRRSLLAAGAAMPLAAVVARHAPAVARQATPAAPVADLVAGNTAFALDLYAELRAEAAGNLLFSPYSISQALAMTFAGASGTTREQMAATLALPAGQPQPVDAFAALNADLVARADTGYGALRIANALWGEQTYPFSADFSAELERIFGAGVQATDFANAPEEARADINAWVAEQTEDRIQDIVPPGAIGAMTRLVLANAIYFYGPWRDTFEASATEDDTFHLPDGSTVTTPFMFQAETFPYASGDGWQAIELPYEQEGFAMTILLPDEGTFETYEAGLEVDILNDAVGQLDGTAVELHLPKFEFDYSESLVEVLRSLGMTDAFDPALADFSGMVEGTPSEELAISDVLHKAFIGVDEDGTEAAAATSVIVGATSAAPPEDPVEVRVDRPFLFAIRDRVTGTLLFLGRVMDPSA